MTASKSGNFLHDIRKMVDDIALRAGCSIYDLEFVGAGPGRTLRVYIDKEIEGGASIEDCTQVTRGLNELLETDEDLIPGGEYLLEVSTPGLERVLKEKRHFEQALGKKISVKTFAPLLEFNETVLELGKAKQIQGPLLSYDDRGLKVALVPTAPSKKKKSGDADASSMAAKEVFVPFETITKAHVVFEFTEPAEKPKGPPKAHKKASQEVLVDSAQDGFSEE